MSSGSGPARSAVSSIRTMSNLHRAGMAAAAATPIYAAYRYFGGRRSSGGAPPPPPPGGKSSVSVARGSYGKRKATKGRRRRTVKKSLANLRNRVSTLSRQQKTSMGELIFHDRQTYAAKSLVNQQTHQLGYAVRTTELETVLAQLRFFDIANPATLVNASGAAGTYSRDYLFKTIYSRLEFMNNYQIPCKVTIYVCCPKEDTSITPTTAFTDGLVDQGNPSNVSPMVHLTDSIQFNKLWRICKRKSRVLMPGRRLSCTMSVRNVMYDPALVDSHGLVYQTKYRNYQFVVRVEGVIAHDSSVATEQGFAAAGGDFWVHTKYVVAYEAGTDLKYIHINDGADTFTNGALVSEAPIADNIGYSLS